MKASGGYSLLSIYSWVWVANTGVRAMVGMSPFRHLWQEIKKDLGNFVIVVLLKEFLLIP